MGKDKKEKKERKEEEKDDSDKPKSWADMAGDETGASEAESDAGSSHTGKKSKKRKKKDRERERVEVAAQSQADADEAVQSLARLQERQKAKARVLQLEMKEAAEQTAKLKLKAKTDRAATVKGAKRTHSPMDVDEGKATHVKKAPKPLSEGGRIPKIPAQSTPKGKGPGKATSKVSNVKPTPNKALKSTVSTLPPRVFAEPTEVERGAVEAVVPDTPPHGEWKEVVTRAHTRRSARDERPVLSITDFHDLRGHVKLPDLVGPEGSDDEEWFEDVVHPIDWYVELLEFVTKASPNSGVPREERLRLGYAWATFNPGQSCVFSSCHDRSESSHPSTRRTFTTDGRYARHLVEFHRARRPRFGCLLRAGQTACRNDDGSTNTFNSLRRGLFVRHLRDKPHQYSAGSAIKVVASAIKHRQDFPEAAATGKFYLNWENNGDEVQNPHRLHIESDRWAGFFGMNPAYRSQSVNRGRGQSRGGAGSSGSGRGKPSLKRSLSVDTHAASPKRTKAVSSVATEVSTPQGCERRSRDRTSRTLEGDPRPGTSTEVVEDTSFADVVTGVTPVRKTSDTLECPEDDRSREHWSDNVLFGNLSEPGLPDMGFIGKCKGLLEMTGSPVVDDFGRAFRMEATSFMWRLFQRTHDCMSQMREAVQTETVKSMSETTEERFQSVQGQLTGIKAQAKYDMAVLEEKLAGYESIDREFHRVYGARLTEWVRNPMRNTEPLIPRPPEPSTQVQQYLARGRPLSRVDVNVATGSDLFPTQGSPATSSLVKRMAKLGSGSPLPTTPGRGLELPRDQSVQDVAMELDSCAVVDQVPGVKPLVPAPTRRMSKSPPRSASPKTSTPKPDLREPVPSLMRPKGPKTLSPQQETTLAKVPVPARRSPASRSRLSNLSESDSDEGEDKRQVSKIPVRVPVTKVKTPEQGPTEVIDVSEDETTREPSEQPEAPADEEPHGSVTTEDGSESSTSSMSEVDALEDDLLNASEEEGQDMISRIILAPDVLDEDSREAESVASGANAEDAEDANAAD